ncbi:hypothetical protein COCVIDRAFT_20103 [Bipolaris victoriae FI3]|uniref:Uncharacterized protein n=1 Tax=Bipolaris victoriae (strain FI3) TaxID=930091 RepID=W7E4R4_BIPV3|nr:hypothetical protein COCVIDRAFT_20103 [Bipolaris victoriae FI3]
MVMMNEETDEEATRQCRWTEDELQKKRHAICHRGTRERSWADWREIGLGCLRNNERVAEESLIFAVRVDGPCSSCSGDGGPGGTGRAVLSMFARTCSFATRAVKQGQVKGRSRVHGVTSQLSGTSGLLRGAIGGGSSDGNGEGAIMDLFAQDTGSWRGDRFRLRRPVQRTQAFAFALALVLAARLCGRRQL